MDYARRAAAFRYRTTDFKSCATGITWSYETIRTSADLVWAEPDPRRSAPPCDGPFHVRVVGLPRLASPWQAPQSPHREDGGEEPDHADRKQRPDEKEVSAEIRNLAGDADTPPLHVDVGYGQRKERQEKHDDVPRSPFGKHQRSVQPDDGDEHHDHQV